MQCLHQCFDGNNHPINWLPFILSLNYLSPNLPTFLSPDVTFVTISCQQPGHLTWSVILSPDYLSQDCTSANNDFFAELNKSDDINEEAEDQSSTNEEDEKKDGESEISGREVVASTNEKETLD